MSKPIGVISCGKAKATDATVARDLYVGGFYRSCRDFIEDRCDRWVILSAKYGVLMPDQIVGPYDMTLAKMGKIQRLLWCDKVATRLADLFGDSAEYLTTASRLYRAALPPSRTRSPFDDLDRNGIGYQLQYLKKLNERGHT